MNVYRCAEWAHTVQQDPFYVQSLRDEEGVQGIQIGQYHEEVVVLITFPSNEHIKEFMLNRRAYSDVEFVRMCLEYGKDPNRLIQEAQVEAQRSQTVFFM